MAPPRAQYIRYDEKFRYLVAVYAEPLETTDYEAIRDALLEITGVWVVPELDPAELANSEYDETAGQRVGVRLDGGFNETSIPRVKEVLRPIMPLVMSALHLHFMYCACGSHNWAESEFEFLEYFGPESMDDFRRAFRDLVMQHDSLQPRSVDQDAAPFVAALSEGLAELGVLGERIDLKRTEIPCPEPSSPN